MQSKQMQEVGKTVVINKNLLPRLPLEFRRPQFERNYVFDLHSSPAIDRIEKTRENNHERDILCTS